MTVCTFFAITAAQAQNRALSTPAKSAEATQSTPEGEVVSAIRGRLSALAQQDFKAWATFVDDEMLAPREGKLSSKQALVKQFASWPPEVKYYYGPLEEIKVRIHGDTAIVTYLVKQYNDIGGQITFVQTWQIETLKRKDKRWLLIAVADAPIPLPPAPVKVDSQIYEGYVGQYEWAPTLIATITREGDKLIQQLGGFDKEELLPENETTFFSKEEAAASSRYIFVRDSPGRVSHYIYREPGGTDRVVKKIK
jgi:hypothetical protein